MTPPHAIPLGVVVLCLACGGNPVAVSEPARSVAPPLPAQALHDATESRLDALLETWRGEIRDAVQARSGQDEDVGVEDEHPHPFRGTLEEDELISVQWLWGTVALAIFDRDPKTERTESFGPPEDSLREALSGYLVGPDTVVDVAEHLAHQSGDDCGRYVIEDKLDLELDSAESIGFLRADDSVVRYLWLDEGRLRTHLSSCGSDVPENAPIAFPRDVQIFESPCGHSLGCETTFFAGPDAATCLRGLRELEAEVASARAQALLAPQAFADANPVEWAEPDFRQRSVSDGPRACGAPARAERLAARRAILAAAEGMAIAAWEETQVSVGAPNEDGRANGDRRELATRVREIVAELERLWQLVHFSCVNGAGFALQLGTAVYFYDGSDAAPLHMQGERAEYDSGEVSESSLRRLDADGDGWLDWLSSERWMSNDESHELCPGEPECNATLITRTGNRDLSCETEFVQTPHGVLAWEPTNENEPVWTLHSGADIEGELERFSALVVRARGLQNASPALELLRSLHADNAASVVEALGGLGIANAEARVQALLSFVP